MTTQALTAQELFAENERKDQLRLLTCGSVDDGKSTLIGRLLYDSKTLYEDHLASLKKDSVHRGSAGEEIDYALLLDGLKAEREQGITIDVAYRYFSTPRRNFIIADTPGHEQYTRNMATGASTADLGVILIDARMGILPQTKRHSFIASLMGIRHIVVAVNKMDLMDYSEAVYNEIKAEYSNFVARLDIHDVHFIPLSALKGDNVVEPSANMPWFHGSPILEYLENVHVASDRNLIDLRFPVQYVVRPDLNYRGFAGTVGSGVIRRGDEVMALPSGRRSRVKSIDTFDGEVDEAFPPMSVCVALEDEIDISRGDMLVHVNNVPRIGRTFEAMVVWMHDAPLQVGTQFMVKHTTNTVLATVSAIRYRVNVNTLHREDAEELELNEIGRVVLRLHRPLAYDPYAMNQATGSFIMIGRINNATVAAGTILEREPNELVVDEDMRREGKSTNVHEHRSGIGLEERLARLEQKPAAVWMTGLPKAGKSTIAYALERRLFDMGYMVNVVDGENMRLGISNDLGFSADDRSENIRRAIHLTDLCNQLGMMTIAAFVSPYEADRTRAREVLGDRFLEVFVDAPLEVCRERDSDDLYARAETGEISNFSGVSAPYEPPETPDLVLKTTEMDVDTCVEAIVQALRERGLLG